jgi:hypothetical protein
MTRVDLTCLTVSGMSRMRTETVSRTIENQ